MCFTSDHGYHDDHDDHRTHHYYYYYYRSYSYASHHGEQDVQFAVTDNIHYSKPGGLHEAQMVQRLDAHNWHRWSHNVRYYESEVLTAVPHGE